MWQEAACSSSSIQTHSTSGVCARESPQLHGDTKGTSLGASPSLSFPSLPGWQAVKGSSPRLGCQGDRASGRKGGAGPSPRGAGSFCGKHKGRVVQRRCPLPAFGGARRGGSQAPDGHGGQPAPTGSARRVGSGVLPPWQEQPPQGATCPPQPVQPVEAMGITRLGTARISSQGCIQQQTASSLPRAPKGGCSLAQEGTIWLTRTAGFMSSCPPASSFNSLSFSPPSPPLWLQSILWPSVLRQTVAHAPTALLPTVRGSTSPTPNYPAHTTLPRRCTTLLRHITPHPQQGGHATQHRRGWAWGRGSSLPHTHHPASSTSNRGCPCSHRKLSTLGHP